MTQNILNIAKSINFYFSAVLVPVGIVFNLLTILIFQTRSFYNTNIRIYYTVLGIHDIFALFNSIFFLQLFPSLGYNFDTISNLLCKFILLWRRIAIQSPSWVQVIITLDRYKTICHSKSSKNETKRSIILKILGLLVFMFFLNMVHLWYSLKETVVQTSVFDNTTNEFFNLTKVNRVCTAPNRILLTTDIITVLFRSYIPFFVMLIMNLRMSFVFFRSRQKFKLHGSMNKKEYYFTFTVITMNFTFFFLYFPWSVWYLLNRLFTNQMKNSIYLNSAIVMLRSFSFSMAYMNNFSSFFLNLTFNKIFRNVLFSANKVSSVYVHSTQNGLNNNPTQ